MGQNTTPNDGDLEYPCDSLEILSCSLEVLICQTLQIAKRLPKDMYELNMYLHEISIAKWEAYLDIYTASIRSSSSDTPRSSGIGHASVAQQRKVCEEAQDHIQWNMRVEALNSIITDNDPMAKKFRMGNWKRLQRNFEAARKPIEIVRRHQSEITATSGSGRQEIREPSEDIVISGSGELNIRETTSKQEAEDAQQSLNRLAYLGGIFLPFSIVAAIFSMGQDFAAGMRLFYVYWVISLPLSLGVIATIYADSIRRLTPTQLDMRKHGDSDLEVNAFAGGRRVHGERPLGWLGAYATLLRYR